MSPSLPRSCNSVFALLQAALYESTSIAALIAQPTLRLPLPSLLQDDIMYPMLTVDENLTFSARIRLPADFTHGQHLHYVEQAIQVGRGVHAAACLWVCSPLGCNRHGWGG